MKAHRRILFVIALLTGAASAASAQGDGPPPEVRAAVDGLMAMLRGTDDASIQQFAANRLSVAYRQGFAADSLVRHLRAIRTAAQGHLDGIDVARGPDDALVVALGDGRGPSIRVMLDATGKVAGVDLVRAGRPARPAGPTERRCTAASAPDHRPSGKS